MKRDDRVYMVLFFVVIAAVVAAAFLGCSRAGEHAFDTPPPLQQVVNPYGDPNDGAIYYANEHRFLVGGADVGSSCDITALIEVARRWMNCTAMTMRPGSFVMSASICDERGCQDSDGCWPAETTENLRCKIAAIEKREVEQNQRDEQRKRDLAVVRACETFTVPP